jgi:bifunctional non-homologous end joining protein LigD
LLPYLKDRPLVLTRFPDGITGKSFYQKDAPAFVPDWIRTVAVWSEDTQRDIRYFVCDDLETLLYLVNLGTIPLHLWSSRVGSLERPDWCVLDLDPKDAPFRAVVTIARYLHDLCAEAGLPTFVKTTGKTGLHVLIPLGGQCTHEQSRTLGELLARLVVGALGDIATITRQLDRRGAKVYLDYLQNRRGQLLVAPFSVRPLPGAPVSMPLAWREVNARLDPRRYTIRTALARMRRLGADPMAGVLRAAPDLVGALAHLAARAPGPRVRR